MTDITELPEGKLQVWKPKAPHVSYITGEPKQNINEDDIPCTQDDVEYIERTPIPYQDNVPADRELVAVGGLLLAMPKDTEAMMKRIDEAGKPKPVVVKLTAWQRFTHKLSLLNPFRGRKNVTGK